MSQLRDTIQAGRFAVTAEITPPVSGGTAGLLAKAVPLRGVVDAVNVTDGAGARVHMSSLAAAATLIENGIEPVLQMTCRDRNRIALQSDLLGAGVFGITNLLILGGDDPSAGDQPDAKPVFDLNTGELIQVAAQMGETAKLPSGRDIDTPPQFFIGAADLPHDPKPEWTPDALNGKAACGATFIQTQFCYDMDLLRRYMARLSDHGVTDEVTEGGTGKLSFLIGIGPLASAKSANWMRNNLFGTIIPDAIVARLEGATDPKQEGIAICAELMQELAEIDGVAGAHLMAPTNPDCIPPAVAASGLR
jgi:methylenetetrahydrofolate reductase (NADPH)